MLSTTMTLGAGSIAFSILQFGYHISLTVSLIDHFSLTIIALDTKSVNVRKHAKTYVNMQYVG